MALEVASPINMPATMQSLKEPKGKEMDNIEDLPPNVAALIMRIRKKFGTPPKDWRRPTYAEAMEEDREQEEQREISAWLRQLQANDWKIDGIPISSLS